MGLATFASLFSGMKPCAAIDQCLKIIVSYILSNFLAVTPIIAGIHDTCDVSAKISYCINCLKQSLLGEGERIRITGQGRKHSASMA